MIEWWTASGVLDFLVAGGPVMVPIIGSSVIALATFLERSWALRRSAVLPSAAISAVVDHLRAGRFDEALARARRRDSAAMRVFEVAIEMRGQARTHIKERVEEVGHREAADLERFVWVVQTVAATGTLLGLLGTVSGMIATFRAAQVSENSDINALAGGIAEALITTFGGLVVSIPAAVAARVLQARIDSLVVDLEDAAIVVIDLVARDGYTGGEP